uniref:WRKY protein n=1 Tax=Salvia miltiorrhiza TaxID=226208 RepID=A0A0D5YAC5_SALMI|nr:WRKY protein [Salvia miltiorrhiza]
MASSSCVHRNAVPERVMTELTRGREIADRIRLMLRETGFDGSAGSVFPVQSLVSQLLDTFTHSLAMLRDGGESDEASQALSAAKLEDSGDSCKTPAAKDRRGCYKRKKSSETRIKESSDLFEDGHAWRKYGQKSILNAKHPRNYYRCTHKFDQKCLATKQVQKIQDEPPLYRTTYNGQHTCNKSALHHHVVPASPDSSSVMWSFNSIKQEEEIQMKTPDEYYISPHHFSPMSSDVYSCSHSIEDVDDIVGSFEDYFEFETLS